MAVNALKRKTDSFSSSSSDNQGASKKQRTVESGKAEKVADSLISASNNNEKPSSLSDKRVEQVPSNLSSSTPDEAQTLHARGNVLANQNSFSEAIGCYRQAFDKTPQSSSLRAQICLDLSVALHKRADDGDIDEEIRTLILGLQPQHEGSEKMIRTELTDRLGHAYLGRQNYPEAIKVFSEGEKLSNKGEEGQFKASMLGGIGFAYEKMGKFDEAAKMYSAACDAGEVDALSKVAHSYNLCIHLQVSEGIKLANDLLRTVDECAPSNRRSYLKALLLWRLGNLLITRQEDGDKANAIKCCEQAAEVQHQDRDELLKEILILAVRIAGLDPQQAIAEHRKYEAGMDIRIPIYDLLGHANLELGDFSSAIRQFTTGLKLFQNAFDCVRKARILGALGFAHERMGMPKEALVAYRKAAAVKHDHSLLAARILYKQGQLESPFEAVKCFYQAYTLPFESTPLRVQLCSELGNLYASYSKTSECFEQAVVWYEKAKDLGSDHRKILARICKDLGDRLLSNNPDKAISYYDKFLSLDPDPLFDGQICMKLGLFFIQQNSPHRNPDRAIEYLVRGMNGQHKSSHLEAEMRYMLGMIFAEQNLSEKIERILEHLEAARKITESLHPKHKSAHEDYDLRERILESLAFAYSFEGAHQDMQKAIDCLQSCLTIDVAVGSSWALPAHKKEELTLRLAKLKERLPMDSTK